MRSLVLLAALLSSLSLPAAQRAVPADRFVDSVGINVHWSANSYRSNWSTLKQKLGELGVRHQRDGAIAPAYPRARELFQDFGIKTLWITGRREAGPWPQRLVPEQAASEIAELRALTDCTIAIEGPNEYDIMRPQHETNWPGTLRRYHEAVYQAVRADPVFDGIPVVGPSLTSLQSYQRAGNYADIIDATCLHHYQSTRHPGTTGWGDDGYGSIDWALRRLAAAQGPGKPGPWSTECGYNRELGAEVHPRYINRTSAEFFRSGYIRSFKYELLGDEWGLLRGDLSETPAFTALKNLLNLLSDRGPEFEPSTLRYTLDGDLTDIRQLLLQKRDGRFYLILWQEVASWDPIKERVITVAPRPIALHLGRRFAQAAAYEPMLSAEPHRTVDNAQQLNLMVNDHLLVIELTPTTAPSPETASAKSKASKPAITISPELDQVWAQRLLQRTTTSLAQGRSARLELSAMGGQIVVLESLANDTIEVSLLGTRMRLPFDSLQASDRASLAADLARRGQAEDHAIAAYHLLRIGNSNAARDHLWNAGTEAAQLKELFALAP
ncbi:MAG: hypothetical protein PF961_08710 [Planctomycetota bacterium]|jgi:hypothetical protein|nr:hypothetical protein [Planctomycetota bacterium]